MSKVMSAAAAAALVRPGDTVGIGGMLLYRRPVGLVLELVRRATPDLTLLGWTLGFEADLLVGAGLVQRVRTSYFGLEAVGLAPMFRQAAEAGGLRIVEETESTLAFGLRAALQGVGFMPARALMGTDIPRVRPDIRFVRCPYTGEELPAMPAVRPRVALIHALQADSFGNAVLGANLSIDVEMARLAEVTIVSAEAVVERGQLPAGMVDLPGSSVHAVVPLGAGAWPTSCFPAYPVDIATLVHYLTACSKGGFADFVKDLLQRPPRPPDPVCDLNLFREASHLE